MSRHRSRRLAILLRTQRFLYVPHFSSSENRLRSKLGRRLGWAESRPNRDLEYSKVKHFLFKSMICSWLFVQRKRIKIKCSTIWIMNTAFRSMFCSLYRGINFNRKSLAAQKNSRLIGGINCHLWGGREHCRFEKFHRSLCYEQC